MGAVAAAAFLWVVPPGEMALNDTTIPGYELRTVVGVSLIVGTAGGAIISALQERAKALVTGEQKRATLDVATVSLNSLRSLPVDSMNTESVNTQIDAALRAIHAAAGDDDPELSLVH